MLRQALLGMAVVSACWAGPVSGQEVKLQLKFKEGEKYWVEDVGALKQTITVMGMVQKIDMTTTTLTSYTVQKVSPDGIVLKMKIEDVNVKSEGAAAGGLEGIASKTKGANLTITMTPEGKLKKVEGVDEFAKKLIDDDEAAKLMKEFINEDTFTKGIENAYGFVPDKAVKKGDTWTTDSKLSLGPLGFFKLHNIYVYNGKKDSNDQIDAKVGMDYMPPKGEGALGGLLKVTRGDLKGDGKTVYLFDSDKGRLVSSNSTMKMQGNLTIEAGGQELPLALSMDMSSNSRLLDKAPEKK